MRLQKVTLATLIVLVTVGIIFYGNGTKGRTATLESLESADTALNIIEQEGNSIEGNLDSANAKPILVFESKVREVQSPNRSNGDANDDLHRIVNTRIDVAGTSIKAHRDLRTQNVLTGAGGKSMSVEQKQVLTDACKELEIKFGSLGTTLPQETDLLLRTICYYAEAPIGLELNNRLIDRPQLVNEVDLDSTWSQNAAPETKYLAQTDNESVPLPTLQQCQQAERSANFMIQAACQRSGGDGVIEFRNCGPHRNNLCIATISIGTP